jgi:pimeloyl-ACP methyl ester carboxylesterase
MSLQLEATLTIILVVVFLVMRLQLHKRAKAGLPGFVTELVYGLDRMRAGLSFRRVDIQDFTIAYNDSGKGEEIVFLLHGFGGEKDDWNPIAAQLSKAYRVIIPDLPGAGESTRPGHAKYDPVAQARRLGAIKKKLGINAKVHLVGIHTGGAVAGLYASVATAEVKTLTMIEPFGIEAPVKSDVEGLAERGWSPLTFGNASEFERVQKLFFAKPVNRSKAMTRRRLERGVRYQSFESAVWKDLWANRPYVLQAVLGQIKVPTLVLWGDGNKVCHQSSLPIIEASLPGVTTIQLRGAGHLMILERPKEVADLIGKLLRGEAIGTGKLEKTMVRTAPHMARHEDPH